MSRFCKLSRRWHQQFLRSPAIGGHWQCLEHFQPTLQCRHARTGTRPRVSKRLPRDEVRVREFEQIGDDRNTRVEVDSKADLVHHGARVKAKLDELEKELAIMREGPFGRNSEFMQALPADERERVLEALEAAGALRDNELSTLDTDGTDEIDYILDNDIEEEPEDVKDSRSSTKVTLRIPKRQKAYVKRFNDALEAACQVEDDSQRNLTLWKWYLRCQQHVPNFSAVMPEDVWHVLWSRVDPDHRSKQVITLARDMLAAKIDLDNAQWISYLEALQSAGDLPAAMELWERRKADLEANVETSEAFWAMGVKIYAALGRQQKAQDLAFACLEKGQITDPTILLDIILSWTESQRPKPTVSIKVWTCYLKLRESLSANMSPTMYEKISRVLLKSGYADMALAVFKDLVLSQKMLDNQDSLAVYEKSLALIQDTQRHAITEAQLNRISLTALLVFPPSMQNKYFFGSWLKNLIGLGELDAASTVIELMHERGVRLDAKHMNGLISARLRDGSKSSRMEAERLAWAMINSRIELVNKRASVDTPKMSDRLLGKEIQVDHAFQRQFDTDRVPFWLRRAAPPANIETFSVLLLHYTRRSDLVTAEHLTHVMTEQAQVRPNSFIMNHWLYSSLRLSDLQAVWDKYNSLKNDIRPDLETFCALWDTAKVQYDKSRSASALNFPTSRQLFAEMANWLSQLPEHTLQKAQADFSRDLYKQILRCFCLEFDMPGLLCAMHGLKQRFGRYPDEDTTALIITQASRYLQSATHTQHPLRRRRVSFAKMNSQTAKVTQLLEAVSDKHTLKLINNGINPETLDPESEAAKKLQLGVLSDFIVAVLGENKRSEEDLLGEIRGVAKDMLVALQ